MGKVLLRETKLSGEIKNWNFFFACLANLKLKNTSTLIYSDKRLSIGEKKEKIVFLFHFC